MEEMRRILIEMIRGVLNGEIKEMVVMDWMVNG